MPALLGGQVSLFSDDPILLSQNRSFTSSDKKGVCIENTSTKFWAAVIKTARRQMDLIVKLFVVPNEKHLVEFQIANKYLAF